MFMIRKHCGEIN